MSNIKYKFQNKWDENTSITWWNECRSELNKIIDFYNQWQIEGFPDDQTTKLRALIEYSKQTIGSRDGGSGYMETLVEMEDFVNECATQKTIDMKNFKAGDKCYITENAKVGLGLPDGVEYTIIDILQENVEFNFVLNAEEFGKDWVEFFREEELIAIEQ